MEYLFHYNSSIYHKMKDDEKGLVISLISFREAVGGENCY